MIETGADLTVGRWCGDRRGP